MLPLQKSSRVEAVSFVLAVKGKQIPCHSRSWLSKYFSYMGWKILISTNQITIRIYWNTMTQNIDHEQLLWVSFGKIEVSRKDGTSNDQQIVYREEQNENTSPMSNISLFWSKRSSNILQLKYPKIHVLKCIFDIFQIVHLLRGSLNITTQV